MEQISAGGYGAVYCVKSPDGSKYALKVERREPTRNHYKLTMEMEVGFVHIGFTRFLICSFRY